MSELNWSSIDLNKICRICLTSEGLFLDLFSDGAKFDLKSTLACAIMECSSVNIYPLDGLPSQICNLCVEKLINYYQFPRLCEKSDSVLRQYLDKRNSWKTNDENENKNNRPIKTECEPITIIKQEQTEVFIKQEELPQNYEIKWENYAATIGKTPPQLENSDSPKALLNCTYCEKTFTSKIDLVQHEKIHDTENPYKCTMCEKRFMNNYSLQVHLSTHSDGKPHNCTYCGKTFSKKCNLVNHEKTHLGARPYVCMICHKGFTQKSHLCGHLKIHRGERPFKCSDCDKTFVQRSHLITHRRLHTGERPYKCELCPKGFTQKGHLNEHMTIHNDVRLFTCDVCNKSFRQKGAMNEHKTIHYAGRMFKCEICFSSFKQKSVLHKHKLNTGHYLPETTLIEMN